MNRYYIYKHTNMINNKIYIGKTCQSPEKRYGSNGIGYKACPYFFNAIQKYGWKNFKHEILFSELSAEEANRIEKQLIKEYNSCDPNIGYNIRTGGDGFQPEDSKRLWNDPQYSKKISEINKQIWADKEYHVKRSKLYKEQWRDPDKRKRRSEQAIERWSDKNFHDKVRKAVLDACATQVRCIETEEVFDAIVDACEKYKIHHSNLIRAIHKGGRSGGYHWEYA